MPGTMIGKPKPIALHKRNPSSNPSLKHRYPEQSALCSTLRQTAAYGSQRIAPLIPVHHAVHIQLTDTPQRIPRNTPLCRGK